MTSPISDPTIRTQFENRPPKVTKTTTSFAELGVREEIVRALAEDGIEHTFAIQELTLPLALAGDDLIGQARTGMGKTLAFGVPLLHRIVTDIGRPLNGMPRALVVVPTRELCLQVYDDLANAAKYLRADVEGGGDRKLSVTSIYGGRPYEPQIEALQKGVDVVVGTPGRLLDLAQQGHLQLGGLSVLVLDEADEMLDLGFLPDIERILRQIPDERQAMLFSATMPDPIITLARTFMKQPTHIRAEAPHSSATHDTTKQYAYRAHALDKVEMVDPGAAGPRPRRDDDLHPHQADRTEGRPTSSPNAVSRSAPCTATSARAPGRRRSSPSAPATSTCWSPPTSPPAASTSTTSRT